MKDNDFYQKHYRSSVVSNGDKFTVDKTAGSHWLEIEMNGGADGRITFRSQQHFEQAIFLMQQVMRVD